MGLIFYGLYPLRASSSTCLILSLILFLHLTLFLRLILYLRFILYSAPHCLGILSAMRLFFYGPLTFSFLFDKNST
jgi:hypothetical protein